MIKVLITGNSGYIGSHLSKMLLENKEVEIHGLDRYPAVVALHKQFICDITSDTNWPRDQEYDCVIHLAAEVSVNQSMLNPTLYYLTNLVGTINVLKNIKTKRLIVASTGAADSLSSPYGFSKRAMEDVVIEHSNKTSIPFTIFRFYNVIGSDGFSPTNPDGLFSNLILSMKTGTFTIFGNDYNTDDGTCIRDYTHVNEICKSLIKGIYKSTNQIENLGHGIGTSVFEIVKIFKSVNNCSFDVVSGPRREGDIEISVLKNPSSFMEKLYTIEKLLKI